MIDGEKRAYGVKYVRHGATHYVNASSEIIVSAGVVGSPKLLMLSGIGSRDDLEALGVSFMLHMIHDTIIKDKSISQLKCQQ